MIECNDKPVILGTSITGLLISLSLSRSGIEHILIGGGPPQDVPRLGESLNECAGPGLWREFGGEFADCFHSKSHISLLNGRYASMAYLSNPSRSSCSDKNRPAHGMEKKPSRLKLFWSSIVTGKGLLHIDRIRFDRKVYDKALQQNECLFVSGMVDHVELDGDSITQIGLADGRKIDQPKYVFDALGFKSPVSRDAGLTTESLSTRQRVVWTHYQKEEEEENNNNTSSNHDPTNHAPSWWLKGTNLLRLDKANDGLDGISWLIPIGDTVSVGISVDDESYGNSEINRMELIETMNRAWKRRGLDYRAQFPRHERETPEIVHRYYRRERASGANWLLAGGSYISVWFPSSAGMWTSLAAARLAPFLLDEPQKYGARYQSMMTDSLVRFHKHLGEMVEGPVFTSNRHVFRFWAAWLAAVPNRFADYLHLELGCCSRFPVRSLKWISKFLSKHTSIELISHGFPVIHLRKQADLARQGEDYDHYFHKLRFHISNIVRGPLQYIGWWKKCKRSVKSP